MFDLEKYQFREAAITTAAIGVATAGFQIYQGAKQKKDAKNALNNYNRQDLDQSNPYENMPISTVGSDIMREENQRNNANAVDALRNGGARGIAMIPQVVAANNRANQETRGYLDDQITRRNYAIAGDKTAIRGMKEDRDNQNIAALSSGIQQGQQNMWSGFRGMSDAAMSFANNYKPAENAQISPEANSFVSPGANLPAAPTNNYYNPSNTPFSTSYQNYYSNPNNLPFSKKYLTDNYNKI